jgi:acyl transferase domain-containing protein
MLQSIPPLSRAFLSAVFEDAVTISGPPCIIKHLLEESDYFKSRPNSPCKTYGLYHAPHLYGPSDVDNILRGITFPTIDRSSRSLLSSVGGYTVTAMNVRSALEQAILEILTLPTNWTSVVDGVLHQVTASGRKQCQIMTFSHSRPSEAVIKSLKDRLGLSVELQNLALFEGGRSEGGTDKIAIIGVAGRFPGATDLDGLWRILEQGRDLHQVIPSSRFDPNTHVDPTGKRKNTSYTPYGCFIEEPGLFDNRFFNMSPRESVQTDPMHRLALVTAYEALEMAGFVPNNTPSTMLERIGTFYGQTSDDWREVNGAQSIGTYFIPGGVRAFAPGRINYFFKFGGPSYSIDTACSSGLAAIQVACSSLLRRECDMALSGGLNILTNPDIYAGLSRGQFLSKTGGCRVFDAEADGYCRADAIGSVVLKRLEDAEADNDKILGVILGSATNHSAQAISITHPHAESQASLYRNILNSAGTDALDVGYVETHGTGTQAGDSVEMQSVTDVFAPESRHRRTPLYLGSIKANVGHSEAAAGVTALFKLLLMLQRDMIPRHIGVKTALNPNFPANLTSRNVHVPAMAVPWSSDVKKLAFLNSFSAAGGNTALLLEEYRSKARSQKADPRSTHVICMSAKSPASLKRAVEKIVDYLHRQKWTSLSNLAYSLSARRMHYSYRLAAVVSRVDEIESRLLSALAEPLIPVTPSHPKLVYVFTGQGAFYTSLGKALFQTSLVFRNALLRLNSIAEKQSSVCFLPAIEGQTSEENSPVVSQVAQVCVQIALAELWSDWNVKPDAVIGHSLGEYAALNTAGVLSASDTIYLVAERAKLLQDRCTAGTHGMLAARLSPSMLERVQEEIPCEIACLNGREDIILSGSMDDVGKTSDILSTSGIRSIQLNLEYAFHSAQVDPVLDAFEDLANGVNFHTPRVPILSPLLGTDIREAGVVSAAYLRRHMREQVNFVGALTHARNHNIVESGTTFLEIGPHPICSKMVCSILEHVNVVSSMRKDEDSWLTLSKSLASLYLLGYDIQWNKVHRDFESAHELLHLPSYSFDERNFWTDYQGDWCLTKGESHPALPPAAPPNEDLPLWQRKSNLSTSSVHCIVEETVKNGQAKVVIQTDLSEGCLNGLIRGHMVSGKAVFPSVNHNSLVCDSDTDNAPEHVCGYGLNGCGLLVQNGQI